MKNCHIRNVFTNTMSTDIKLSKAQISRIIQSGGSFGSWLGNLKAHRQISKKLSSTLTMFQDEKIISMS